MKKFILAFFLLWTSLLYADCDLEYATNALSESTSLYEAYRDQLTTLSQLDEELFYKRKSITQHFTSSDALADALKVENKAAQEAVRSSLEQMDRCTDKIDSAEKFLLEYVNDSKLLQTIIEDINSRCANSGDSSFKAMLKRNYNNRQSYISNIDHLRSERILKLKTKCDKERDFVKNAIKLAKTCDLKESLKAMVALDNIEAFYKDQIERLKLFDKQINIDVNPYYKYFKTPEKLVEYLNQYGNAATLSADTALTNAKKCIDDINTGIAQVAERVRPTRISAADYLDEHYEVCQKYSEKFAKQIKEYQDNYAKYEALEKEVVNDWFLKIQKGCKEESRFIKAAINNQKNCF